MQQGNSHAAFDVDEQSYLKYVAAARGAAGSALPVFLGLADEDGYGRPGRIASVDEPMDRYAPALAANGFRSAWLDTTATTSIDNWPMRWR